MFDSLKTLRAIFVALFFGRRALVVFFVVALFLLLVDRTDGRIFGGARGVVMDATAPVFLLLRQPVDGIRNLGDYAASYIGLRTENARLRAENARLRAWRDRARVSEKKLLDYESLLKTIPDTQTRDIAARILADTGGAFVRAFIVNAGRAHGVREGQAVLGPGGLIGRIITTGRYASRVLLLTDLNSRIPVAVGRRGARAILAGDNGPTPRLDYLNDDAYKRDTMPVLTSGHGGLFPPGLPVGTLIMEGDRPHVRLAAELARTSHVRILSHRVPALDDAAER